MATKSQKILWLGNVEEHDYPAAASYLGLIYDDKRVKQIVKKLRKASIEEFKAKDVFRASSLSLLGLVTLTLPKTAKKLPRA